MQRWRPRHLLYAWVTYWVLLALYALGPAALAFQRGTDKPHGKLGATAGFEDDKLYGTITDGAATLWHATIPFTEAVLWVVLPPLILWLLWLALGSRRAARVERV